MSSEHSLVYLDQYTAPACRVTHVDATFDIMQDYVIVEARLAYQSTSPSFTFHGESLEILSLKVNGHELLFQPQHIIDEGWTFVDLPLEGEIFQKIKLYPNKNTALSGLYRSGSMLCTQCEAEGFRRIMLFPDRPDVQSLFKITLIADKERYPVLLSNGNLIESSSFDNKHQTTWFDPFPKPSYLFALVAGDLALTQDNFVTLSGKDVALKIYTDHHEQHRTAFAMQALKAAMKWDEHVYGLEYDLSVYHVVATHDFNMGAMENKSLNIFNARFVLGDHQTVTDRDYINIMAVVGHEYFHNYTGNRVTLRDWFQLSLKEGLTVFREQQFMADILQSPMRRIDDVHHMLSFQFPEDGSPLAHPVRPAFYKAIDNFYTTTVYEKGAEVIRMLSFYLTEPVFMAGVRRYLKRFDGQAATINDWLSVMSECSGRDLTHFAAWYDTPHTPSVKVTLFPNEILLTQEHPLDQLFVIPLSVAFWSQEGCVQQPTVHILEKKTMRLPRPSDSVPSFNHQFAAPIFVNVDYTKEQLDTLLQQETDPVTLWLLMQDFWINILLKQNGILDDHNRKLVDSVWKRNLTDGLKAMLFSLPSLEMILLQHNKVCPLTYANSHKDLQKTLANSFFLDAVRYCEQAIPSTFDPLAIEQRQLAEICYVWIALKNPEHGCLSNALRSSLFTTRLNALKALVLSSAKELADQALESYYAKEQDNPLMVAHWLRLQALQTHPTIIMQHPAFDIKNPNKVYAFVGTVCNANHEFFHQLSGEGYQWWADLVVELDAINPQVASKIAKIPKQWKRWDERSIEHFKAVLTMLADQKTLSVNTQEIIQHLIDSDR